MLRVTDMTFFGIIEEGFLDLVMDGFFLRGTVYEIVQTDPLPFENLFTLVTFVSDIGLNCSITIRGASVFLIGMVSSNCKVTSFTSISMFVIFGEIVYFIICAGKSIVIGPDTASGSGSCTTISGGEETVLIIGYSSCSIGSIGGGASTTLGSLSNTGSPESASTSSSTSVSIAMGLTTLTTERLEAELKAST